MNFLAHLYLSGNNEPIMVGNFIADHIRGYNWKSYPQEIQQGIVLHRFIDEFTDHHPTVERTKALLRPVFHKYSPVISDIYYDHFLASGWLQYSSIALIDYSRYAYQVLHNHEKYLPERTQRMLNYMEADNWLLNYASLDGLNKALSGMGRRARFENNMNEAAAFLAENYLSITKDFSDFFPELEAAVSDKIKLLQTP